MSHSDSIEDDLARLSPGPWSYLLDDGAHYVLSGSGKTIAVFAEERDARNLVEIIVNLPCLLEEFEISYTKKEYDEVVENNTDLEKDVSRLEEELTENKNDVVKLEAKVDQLGELEAKVDQYETFCDEAADLLDEREKGISTMSEILELLERAIEERKRLEVVEAGK